MVSDRQNWFQNISNYIAKQIHILKQFLHFVLLYNVYDWTGDCTNAFAVPVLYSSICPPSISWL